MIKLLHIAGKFWVTKGGSNVNGPPFDDGRYFRVFDDIADAVAFRRSLPY